MQIPYKLRIEIISSHKFINWIKMLFNVILEELTRRRRQWPFFEVFPQIEKVTSWQGKKFDQQQLSLPLVNAERIQCSHNSVDGQKHEGQVRRRQHALHEHLFFKQNWLKILQMVKFKLMSIWGVHSKLLIHFVFMNY